MALIFHRTRSGENNDEFVQAVYSFVQTRKGFGAKTFNDFLKYYSVPQVQGTIFGTDVERGTFDTLWQQQLLEMNQYVLTFFSTNFYTIEHYCEENDQEEKEEKEGENDTEKEKKVKFYAKYGSIPTQNFFVGFWAPLSLAKKLSIYIDENFNENISYKMYTPRMTPDEQGEKIWYRRRTACLESKYLPFGQAARSENEYSGQVQADDYYYETLEEHLPAAMVEGSPDWETFVNMIKNDEIIFVVVQDPRSPEEGYMLFENLNNAFNAFKEK